MLKNLKHDEDFSGFKNQYNTILDKFLNEETTTEMYLNEGYKLGRLAVTENLNIISVAAIHHDCLISFLEKLEKNGHLQIAEKASLFLEEVLAPFQMVAKGFREAINLLNKRSVEYAVRIKSLKSSLKEKESLLQEIYHRVKNNLQIISSLLHLQLEATGDPSLQQLLLESVTRVKSMALVHEMLYQSDNLAKIEMREYIDNLFRYLYEMYNVDKNKIKILSDIGPISLNIDVAISLGLIMNELISNSFKHAFPDGNSGEITFSLSEKNEKLILTVSDNGVGIHANILSEDIMSLGMKLVYNLTKQLDGKIVLDKGKGTTFTLTFAQFT